jgi:hypothetical protein
MSNIDPIILELVGSTAVVLLMISVAALLGFRISARLDADELARLAEAEGVGVARAVFAANRKSALAQLGDGRLMVVRVMGLDVSCRFVAAGAAKLRLGPGRLEATFADVGYPPLHMRLTDQPVWLAELAAGGK